MKAVWQRVGQLENEKRAIVAGLARHRAQQAGQLANLLQDMQGPAPF